MTPLLSAVLDHLWQSTVFAALVWLLTLALRHNRARVRHGVWLAASIKFLIPFSVLIAVGGRVEWRKAPPKAQYQVAAVANQVSEPFNSRVAAIALPSAHPTKRNPLPAILFGLWAIGFVSVAATWLIRWRRIRAAVHPGSPIELDIPIRAVSSPARLEPGVFGVLRPVLVLPDGIAERLTREQLNAVIEHELCHVRHRDNLTAAVHMMVEALFWFHPLVWWIEKRMVEERERACDEEVVRRLSDTRAYAEGILNVCKLYIGSPLACVSGVGGANLRRRLEAIISRKLGMKLDGTRKAALAAAGAIAVALPLGIGLVNAPFVHAQTTEKFEVASIRLGCGEGGGRDGGTGGPGGARGGFVPPSSPGRLSICLPLVVDVGDGRTLIGLIPTAYGRFANGHGNPLWAIPLIEGGPAWVRSDSYAISARAADDASLEMMQGPMLQALLEDRFRLKMHRETRRVPAYELVVAKSGPKLKPFQEGSCAPTDWTKSPLPPGQALAIKLCNSGLTIRNRNYLVSVHGATLEQVGFMMSLAMDRPVIDKTGLTGLYDVDVEFETDGTNLRPPPPQPGAAAPEPAQPGPSIFTAVQEQLGLKLQEGKGPREVLVIDHVERPTEN